MARGPPAQQQTQHGDGQADGKSARVRTGEPGKGGHQKETRGHAQAGDEIGVGLGEAGGHQAKQPAERGREESCVLRASKTLSGVIWYMLRSMVERRL